MGVVLDADKLRWEHLRSRLRAQPPAVSRTRPQRRGPKLKQFGKPLVHVLHARAYFRVSPLQLFQPPLYRLYPRPRLCVGLLGGVGCFQCLPPVPLIASPRPAPTRPPWTNSSSRLAIHTPRLGIAPRPLA